MRKKRLITCIMVIAVVYMISVNAFAINKIFMGEKSYTGIVNFSITSHIYVSKNDIDKVHVEYMTTEIVNNGAGPVDNFKYRVTNNAHNIVFEYNSDQHGIPAVLPGETDVYKTPQPLVHLNKIVICEIGAGSGTDTLWLVTIINFPAGSTSYYLN